MFFLPSGTPKRVSESLEVPHRIYVVIRQNYGMKKISVYFSFYGDVSKLIESQFLTQSYHPNYLFLKNENINSNNNEKIFTCIHLC